MELAHELLKGLTVYYKVSPAAVGCEELKKYKDLNHAEDFFRVMFASNSQFQEVRDRPGGVGRDTLVKFLGGKLDWLWRVYIGGEKGVLKNKVVNDLRLSVRSVQGKLRLRKMIKRP